VACRVVGDLLAVGADVGPPMEGVEAEPGPLVLREVIRDREHPPVPADPRRPLRLADARQLALPAERDRDRPVEPPRARPEPLGLDTLVLGVEPELPGAGEAAPVLPAGRRP